MECFKKKRDRSTDDANKKQEEDKALVADTKTDKCPAEMTLPASSKVFIDSEATAHVMKNVSVTTGKALLSYSIIGTSVEDTIKAAAQDDALTRTFGGEKLATLNSVLDVPDVERSLISVLLFCDDNHTA